MPRTASFVVSAVLAAGTSPIAAHAASVTAPPGSDLSITGPGFESPALIEHFPFANLISWEIFTVRGRCFGSTANPGFCAGGPNDGAACTSNAACASSPLTFTGGEARLYDRDGNLIDVDGTVTGAPIPITPALFEQTVRWFGNEDEGVPDNVRLADLGVCQGDNAILCVGPGSGDALRCGSTGNNACDPRPSAGFVPANSNLGIPFPFERLAHNVLAFSSEMDLCFEEFESPPGTCQPLQVLDVALEEYHHRGQTYIYPLGNPPSGTLFSGPGGGHEINASHRLARNQRYAYDVGVLVGGTDHSGTGAMNSDYFIYQQPLYAMADGTVVTLEKGHLENTMPPDLGFGGFCQSRRCDGTTVDTCSTGGPGQADDIIPGSGNSLVIAHPSGEHTGYAHMMTGSNDFLSCFAPLLRGDQIGVVGNSGGSSAPHHHFGSLNTAGPEDPGNYGFPIYWNNVEFRSRPIDSPRRQLDTGMPTLPNGITWTVLDAPSPLPPNASLGSGNVAEVEPNDVLADHNTIEVPATVQATLEDADVGDLAVRGDGIEDIYRVDLQSADSLRFDLVAAAPANLDLYLLNEDLLVLNETLEGTSQGGVERACFELEAGAYYAMVTNVDLTRNGDVGYTLDVASDPQTVTVTIEQGAATTEVDEACDATVEFSIALHDNCCLDPDALGLVVTPSSPTANLTIGTVELDPPQTVSATDVVVTGRVEVSDVTSCPAVLRIGATASDCTGNVVDTASDGGGDEIEVLDTLPPTVASSVAVSRLWPANHKLVGVGFERSASDNCDAGVEASLETRAWSDEEEAGAGGTGRHAPDAKDVGAGLRLRAEREGPDDGRVYLLTSTAADACGNSAFSCATVGVAHDRGTAAEASLAGQIGAAQAYCEANDGAPPPEYHEIGLSAERGPWQ